MMNFGILHVEKVVHFTGLAFGAFAARLAPPAALT
jgi:hypothetical protein